MAANVEKAIEAGRSALRRIDVALRQPPRYSPAKHVEQQGFTAVPEVRELYPILLALYRLPVSQLFQEPVNALEYETTLGYHDMIESPMSLRDILERIVRGEYSNTDQVHHDIGLIWTNCATFNGGAFANQVAACKQKLDQLIQEHADKKLIPLAQQEEIIRYINECNEEFSGNVMGVIKRLHPKALGDEGDLDLEQLSWGAFREIRTLYQKRPREE